MFSKKINEINNPIIYMFLTLILSCISYGLFDDFKKLTIFIVCFFFISIIIYCGFNFTILMIVVFILGLIINISYYSIDSNIESSVRILRKNSYEITADYQGKKILLETNNDVKVGREYKINSKIIKSQEKSKGVVGKVITNDVNEVNEDFIVKLYKIKHKVFFMLKENLGQRKAALISSVAFGYSNYLDKEDKSDMKKFGIIHTISISGLHVVIVYIFLKTLLGNKMGLIATIIYVIFTGCNYSSIRAFIMLSSLEISKIIKRNNNSLSALCLSGMVLVLIKPYSIFEVSFHLSYLSTLGIVIFNKKLNNYFYKLPDKLRTVVSISLAAQVFTFPYLILVFKDFSINFIIGNLILVPFINIIVITGNILPIVYIFPKLFDFCSYLNLIIIKLFDWSLDKLENYSIPMFYGNEYVAILYMSILISIYFINKNYREFIYLPAIFILLITIQIYSPIPKITYYNEGALLISYRGERALVTNKNNIDIKRLKKATMSNKVYRNNKIINIKNIGKIKEKGKNYFLETSNNLYILKISNSKISCLDYDIINFKDQKINKIFILKDRIILSI
ncbi:ComEC/Rec2 family competence protein [Clostridium weizhouense]|uniref:ComEC/Rec2 family competence protein n=1 Tax=Clostridium weizhouense TaxID=2859781 RepID=A0ABS7AM04_9CLOT|nr:ComEC/Rec2 family competence protein [Clostridium weizhouense]MBW6408525.1 ComEC/Rec2 family competence protein [Clostridium weizhouense]